MFKLPSFSKETRAKQQVDQLTEERSQIRGYAAMAGNLLGTLRNDLSGGPKFAYELLQNAHDTGSSSHPVSLYLYHHDEYLIWAHSGDRLFTPDDVEGISNAARSNEEEVDHKSKNLGMIGYKGIGFKAVLARADRIHIVSGDFSFGFDKAESKKRLASYIAKNKTIEHLWQVLPYWMPISGIDQELLSACHAQFEAFKPLFPEHHCPEPKTFFIMHIPGFDFKTEFSYLQKDLSWMLFLENFSKIVFLNEQVCLARKTVSCMGNQCEIQLIHENKKHILSNNAYLMSSNEIAKTAAIDHALNHLTDYQCPQRLKEARSTVIKIAIALTAERGLQALSAGQLFVGLPLEGHKDENQLVHVQANFLLDTRRYSLTDDGPWNSFLLFSAGQSLVKFLAELALSDEPYWNQTLTVLPTSSILRREFYDGIDEALTTTPLLPSNQNRKRLLYPKGTYLDTTTSQYGTGFYYEFPKLPVVPMSDYFLSLPHRELQGVTNDLIEDTLGLTILLNTLNPDYFKEEALQIRLLNFLGEHPELLANPAVLKKDWILNQHGSFSSLQNIYIRYKIEDDKAWRTLCQTFLDLPRMMVAWKLSPSLRNTLIEAGCKKLTAAEYDRIMMMHLTTKDEAVDKKLRSAFLEKETQAMLLTFLAKQLNTNADAFTSAQLRILKAKKIILVNIPNEPDTWKSLEDSYLPESTEKLQNWHAFCRDFFKLPEVAVAKNLSALAKTVLQEVLGCKQLNTIAYDKHMCAYFFEEHADIPHLQKIFPDEATQQMLVTLMFNQATLGNITSRNFSLLKKTPIFLTLTKKYVACDQLFIPSASDPSLNQNYRHLLQLSELAIAHRLTPVIRLWLSSELGIKEANQTDFQSRFFTFISAANAETEEHLQKCYDTPEAQLSLLNFIASPAGDNHRAQIKEKSIVLVNTRKTPHFSKPAEVYTLSDTLTPEDLVLVSSIYPNLPILAAPTSEETKHLYAKQLGLSNLTLVFLAGKIAADINQDYHHPSHAPQIHPTEHNSKLILHFIIRHLQLIEESPLLSSFSYLSLSTLSPGQMRPACFLYLPPAYHPKHSIQISGEADFRETFLSTDYISWAETTGIDFSALRAALLSLQLTEKLEGLIIPSISLKNFRILEPQMAQEFMTYAKFPKTIKELKSVLHHPLLTPLISGRLIRGMTPIKATAALNYLIKALKSHWEKKPLNEASVNYYKTDYTVGFEFIRYAITRLVPDIVTRYYTATETSLHWAISWLPTLDLPEGFIITQKQAQYLQLRLALDTTACELLLARIPLTEHKVAARYYEHYKTIFKFLLMAHRGAFSPSMKLNLPISCLLLAEDDSWQPKENLSYLVLEDQRKRSPNYLKRWPTTAFTIEEQRKLALILGVKILETKDLRYQPLPPIVELPGFLDSLTITGLPYLALAQSQEEAILPEKASDQLRAKLTGWKFIQASKIQVIAAGSDVVLQELCAYQDIQNKTFYLQVIRSRTQADQVKTTLVKLLSELLKLQAETQKVLNFLLTNLDSSPEFTLDTPGLTQDMEDAGYTLAHLHYQPEEIDAALVPDFSALSIAAASSVQEIQENTENPLAVTPLALRAQSASSRSPSKHRGGTGRRSSGGFFGMVRAPDLSAEANAPWEIASQEPRRADQDFSGGMEPISYDTSPAGLDDVKPNQVGFLMQPVITTKTAAPALGEPGYLKIKLDPVAPLTIPPLPSLASKLETLKDFLATAFACVQFSELSDGIGYWGEAFVYCWLLDQKYGSKFKEPMIQRIAPGHCVLAGAIKTRVDATLRIARSYHVIWHREAGDQRAAHDLTVIKTYDTGEQKLSVHEVKATKCSKQEADSLIRGKVSRNQLSEMANYGSHYRFYRVYSVGQQTAELEYYRDPAALIEEGTLPVKSLGV